MIIESFEQWDLVLKLEPIAKARVQMLPKNAPLRVIKDTIIVYITCYPSQLHSPRHEALVCVGLSSSKQAIVLCGVEERLGSIEFNVLVQIQAAEIAVLCHRLLTKFCQLGSSKIPQHI